MLTCFSSKNIVEGEAAAADDDQCHDKWASEGSYIVNTDNGHADQADQDSD